MSPSSVHWRPTVQPASRRAGARPAARAPAGRSRYAFVVGSMLALVLLFGFYSVVSGAVRRADESREQARAEADRKAACGSVSAGSMHDACGVAAARHAPPNTTLKTSYAQPAWNGRRPELTARVD